MWEYQMNKDCALKSELSIILKGKECDCSCGFPPKILQFSLMKINTLLAN